MTTDELIKAQAALIASQQRIIELLAVELRLRVNPPMVIEGTKSPVFPPWEITSKGGTV